MCDQYRKSYRLGRRPGEQGPRPLSRNQDRVEKLATGTTTTTTTTTTTANSSTANSSTTNSTTTNSIKEKPKDLGTTNDTRTSTRPGRTANKPPATTTKVPKDNTQKLKIMKNTFTVGTWNVRTLWAAGKLDLLRHEMNRYRYDIIGISEVRWTGKGE
ncbi:unnamed protein product, partial [Rotaria magnacalcarata]